MKETAEPVNEEIDQLPLLIRTMAGQEARYDPDLRMLRSPFSSPGYHTTLKQAEFIHSTRDSLTYALGLLDTELTGYEQRAFDIIRQVISLQDTDRSHDTFGIWSWFYEEPLDQMAPPDWNWADFCGSRLVQAIARHGCRFPDDLLEAVTRSIEYACEAIIRRNVGPDYTNIAIIGAFVTRIAGEVLGREEYAEYGLERLRKLHVHTLKHGAFQEYNSPVYTYIALLELSKLRSGTTDAGVKALTGELLDLTWKTVAGYYHPATAQWSGPHSRSYGALLDEQSQACLQLATGGAVMFFPWEELPYQEEWYKSGLHCPTAYLNGFTIPETKEVRQRLEGEEPGGGGKWAVTYMTPQWSMGSFTHSDLWNQRRPLLVYADNHGQPAYIRLRCLHDGYDYCSVRFQALQEAGYMLFGIDFLTDGGDTHPNLDRISGVIEAADLRLRLEIGGCLDGVTAVTTDDGASIIIGGTEFDLRTWFIAFIGPEEAAHSRSWEVHRTGGRINIDRMLYSGPRRSIDFTSLEQAALVSSLEVQGDGAKGTAPVLEMADGGRLRVSGGQNGQNGQNGKNRQNGEDGENSENREKGVNGETRGRGVNGETVEKVGTAEIAETSAKGEFVLNLRPGPAG
ncbi:hypothetical protein KDC22_01530 [Paenibacillus tritici]|uniref:hypothetical protein n=1 Tax=Paenibacillus tritici TaxID=1873425 RepID=UPI001BAC49B7|nr:hypothetical protein [Paenibacillus tritici]QUL55293.1 hypothetical protein KDC22_01530 [Paenibacillus tritici]